MRAPCCFLFLVAFVIITIHARPYDLKLGNATRSLFLALNSSIHARRTEIIANLSRQVADSITFVMEELRLNLTTSNEGEEIYIEPADPVETFLDSPNTYMQQFNELRYQQGSAESKESSFQWAKDLMKRGKVWYKSLSPEEKRKLKEKLKVAGKYLKGKKNACISKFRYF
ncbi:unnamed protein product, partial [Mesorhabditis spiculigera]